MWIWNKLDRLWHAPTLPTQGVNPTFGARVSDAFASLDDTLDTLVRLLNARMKGLEAEVAAVGRIGTATRAVTAATTITAADALVLVDTTSGAVTVTLPAAAVSTGKRFTVKKTNAGANNVTLDGDGSETIDGAATLAWNTQYAAYTVQSDGSVWWIV